MYRCSLCDVVVKANQSAIKIVTKSRIREYRDGTGRTFSKGQEIVEEVDACAKCAKEHKGAQIVPSS